MSDINRDWEKVYEVEATPWDAGQPEDALVEFTDKIFVKPCKALEIGCGNGNDAIFLAKKGYFLLIVSSDKETPKGPYQFSKQDIKEIFGNDFDILDIRLITLKQHKENPTPYLCIMKRK